ncbi:MAG: four helix bundle protein [Minisyncoccia bacterium]
MKKFRFLDWEVYRDAKKLFSLILQIVRKLPREFRFEIGSQLIRSAFSIILNIAEGSGKTSDKELNRFIDISLGSISELLAALDVLKDNKLINQEEFDKIFEKLLTISTNWVDLKRN